MPRLPRLQATAVLFLLWVSACHRRQVAVPVPPPPAANQPASQAPAPPAATSGTPTSGTTTQAPAPPVPAAKKPARSAATSPASPTPPAQPSPASAAPAPKLGDILTADERKQYNASVDQSLSHAQASLNSIGGRQLNKDQQAQVEQIRNFMQQAQATRASDLAGAKSLAERAEVLAKDLAANLHR